MTLALEPMTISMAEWTEGDAAERQARARRVDAALRDIGFLVVTDHGVPAELLARARRSVLDFVHLPLAEKQPLSVTDDVYRGWVAPGSENNAATYGVETAPDLKETFVVGPPAPPDATAEELAGPWYTANRFPADGGALETSWTALYAEMTALADRLLDVLAVALGVDPELFVETTRRQSSTLMANWYPPVTVAPEPGQFRIGPHTDFGVMTLLDRHPGSTGLQVQRLDGTWDDVPAVANSLIMNTGDMMALWSGHRWRSARHQIPADGRLTDEQLSLVFFHEPDPNAIVAPVLPAEDMADAVVWGDYLAGKMAQLRGDDLERTSASLA